MLGGGLPTFSVLTDDDVAWVFLHLFVDAAVVLEFSVGSNDSDNVFVVVVAAGALSLVVFFVVVIVLVVVVLFLAVVYLFR